MPDHDAVSQPDNSSAQLGEHYGKSHSKITAVIRHVFPPQSNNIVSRRLYV